MKIIVIAGMPGAGKEELLSVARSLGIHYARMGDAVREFYSRSPNKGMSIGEFASSEREKFGITIWAKRTIEKMNGDMFLIDGCRSMEEVRSFRELGGDVVIIGIYSSPDQRYKRLINRGRDDAPRNIDEFNQRDSREISWGLAEVLALSDIMLVNSSSLEDFHSVSEMTLKGLK
ncbi:MAG: AAA family ATPase [Candidatus Methanoplasma sp.]|nr:AAA family ATPase [Candidatus Methanoplasma sp.]